ncbi:MAG: hypothetical protein ACJAYC_000870 [Halieaceae bacterium]|jgi:hypothetical protein
MTRNRKDDENQKVHYRSDRLVRNGSEWFFETRKGTEGPFDNQFDALAAMQRYTEVVTSEMLPEDNGLSLEPLK